MLKIIKSTFSRLTRNAEPAEQQQPQVVQPVPNLVDQEQFERFVSMLKPVNFQDHLIRIGGDHDGGYLLPDDLDDIDACFSPGVARQISFDNEIAGRGIPVFTCDASVDGLPDNAHELISFDPVFISDKTDESQSKVKATDWIELKLESLPRANNLLLEMDIEGGEYECLPLFSDDLLQKFKIMVIEFHRLPSFWQPAEYDKYFDLFQKLTRYHHVAHMHVNTVGGTVELSDYLSTPRLLEITFYRKDGKLLPSNKPLVFPHWLDEINIPHKRDPEQQARVVLPASWY